MKTILIGKFVGLHATRGELKLLSYGEVDWLLGESVFPVPKGTLPAEGAAPYTIVSMRAHKGKGVVLTTLKGIASIDQARALVGMDVYVDKELLPEPPQGEYYLRDLIGIKVFTEEGVELGRITDIITTGANDVYQVEGPVGELLLPALKEVILSVSVAEKKMIVRPPAGL